MYGPWSIASTNNSGVSGEPIHIPFNGNGIVVKCDNNFDFAARVYLRNEILERLNVIENKSGAPLIDIMMIGLDSASRAQFYRKLKVIRN